MKFLDAHGAGYVAWTWDALYPKVHPQRRLQRHHQRDPELPWYAVSREMGYGYRDHLLCLWKGTCRIGHG